MELLQLKYLCTAARFENFSRAAKFHNIPQSAISKTIAQLERELGTQLFTRNGNRVTLNERGKLFCREVSRALGILGDAAQAVKETVSLHGEVRLLVQEHLYEVLSVISEFKKEYPDVSVSVVTEPREGFADDLRICSASAAGDRLGFEKLHDARVSLLLPLHHPLAGERIQAASLAGQRQILFTRDTTCARVARERLAQAGVTLETAMSCDDRSSLLSCVASGLGVAFTSDISEREAEDAGVAVCRLQEDWRYATCLSYRRALSPAGEALRALILIRLGM
ncbi:MAG: LysR family transcriptional regulator [Clostridia bacterium]|nr:LysR family transcriptional regulator [Clostridia bacterium]